MKVPISDNPSGTYCPDCRATGLSHCSDPINCGGMKKMAGPFTDMHVNPIREGDYMTVHEHANQCCTHRVRCEVKWNEDWKAYGLCSAEGKWISGMGIVSGYQVEPRGRVIAIL